MSFLDVAPSPTTHNASATATASLNLSPPPSVPRPGLPRRPYHSMILLRDKAETLRALPPGSSRDLLLLIQVREERSNTHDALTTTVFF
jgi:hypothetical protein